MIKRFSAVLLSIFCAGKIVAEDNIAITIDAPGTVFTEAEPIGLGLPGSATGWVIRDWRGIAVARGKTGGAVNAGKLPCGYYRIEVDGIADDDGRKASFAVLPAVAPAVSSNSIYGVDAAFSWCCQRGSFKCPWMNGDVPRLALHLIRLAGFSHVRDRFLWEYSNPAPDEVEFGKCLDNARILSRAGLRVTTSFCNTPKHVAQIEKLPSDLVALYRHCRESAAAFGGDMDCWEFWNEPDIGSAPEPAWDFAATQKAAYLGFKDGEPGAIVAPGSVCHYTRSGYDEVLYANGVGVYSDVYNFHTYIPLVDYTNQQNEVRNFLAARHCENQPIYITELGTDLEGDATDEEPESGLRRHSVAQELLVAEFFAKSFVMLANEGVARAYAFIFSSYFERGGRKDWGLLRRDGSVKPAYVSLAAQIAAIGDAEVLGEVCIGEGLRAFLYRHGDNRQTLVFWTVSDMEKLRSKVSWSGLDERDLTLREIKCSVCLTDGFGAKREIAAADGGVKVRACRFPQYLTGNFVLKPDIPSRSSANRKPISRSFPANIDPRIIVRIDFNKDDFRITDRKCRLEPIATNGQARVHVWNLSPQAKCGTLSVKGGTFSGLPETIEVPAMGETAYDVRYFVPIDGKTSYKLTVSGVFEGKRIAHWQAPVRLWDEFLAKCTRKDLEIRDVSRWQRNDNADSFAAKADGNGVRFEVIWNSGDGDKWVYPVYVLDDKERKLVASSENLEFEVRSEQDKVENDFSCQFIQVVFTNGKSRLMPYDAPNGNWELRRLDLREARYDDGEIAAFRFGGNPKGANVKLGFRNMRVLIME